MRFIPVKEDSPSYVAESENTIAIVKRLPLALDEDMVAAVVNRRHIDIAIGRGYGGKVSVDIIGPEEQTALHLEIDEDRFGARIELDELKEPSAGRYRLEFKAGYEVRAAFFEIR